MELVGEQGDDESEQVAAAIVKKVARDKIKKVNEEIKLKQLSGGKKLTVKVESKAATSYKKKEVQVKAKTIGEIRKTLNLSDRQTANISRILRKDKV